MTQFAADWRRLLIAGWSFDEGEGHTAVDLAAGNEDQIEFALRKGRFQPPQEPVWREGISGSALLFDGYSTYIERPSDKVGQPLNGLSISVWVAPRHYDFGVENRLGAIVNQHNREQAKGYLLGVTRHGEWSLQLGLGGEWTEVWSREHTLPRHEWSYVAAVFDPKGASMKLYLNGSEVASRAVPAGLTISPSGENLMIGRNNHGHVLAEAFIMNHFDGMIDELMVYDYVMSAEEVRDAYDSYLQPHNGRRPVIAGQDRLIPRSLFINDRHRPQFHLNPPGHWMNEPHAPIYFDGRYHLFYQFNPNGPFWHYIHWGHWVSDDLVHWRDMPPALYPEAGIDPDGVWSGSAAYDENGQPALFFTAGDYKRSPDQSVGIARSTYSIDGNPDLPYWNKEAQPIVEQKPGMGLFGQFRDPFVWKDGGRWIMLVGSGVEEGGGTALVYVSSDLKSWTYEGLLFTSDYASYPHLGTVWELPVLLPLACEGVETGKHIFLISPWGEGAKPDVNYWIGTFDRERLRFIPDEAQPQLIDVGDFHFTGPSGMVDPVSGRTLLFTIAQGERTPEIDYDCGWSHSAGMPVSLSLRRDGRLSIEPIEEAKQLRERLLLDLRDVTMEEANRQLQNVRGNLLDIEIAFRDSGAKRYGISLRRSPEGEEETVLFFDRERQLLGVDRSRSSLDSRERPSGVQQGAIALNGEPLKLRILVDRSLIEAYANGLTSLTTRTYPSRTDADGIRLFADGNVEVESIRIWSMGPVFRAVEG
ncbi:GH32 C-terminal domain-containing protein [Paenibacillus beijingensis]|uniref:beta-fructofuranosidase n=1 Tax=Paenibacillus beijingensis TaxID=1126833 RepID=A0A0D5NGL0_9BACL|nr:GH32 C-terminal domain-containing protein [Paenibacillus beijingensis]AJY74053.1 glycoside hydrolase [Paenibacillus beijingensis]